MESVSIRELRNSGGDVVDRVQRGERLRVTRDGAEVAELRPLPRPTPSTAALIASRQHLPAMDPAALRHDLDEVVDQSL